MLRADVSVGVTGSLVAALALSYALFPGSVVPRPAEQVLADVPTDRDPTAEVLVPATAMGDPLSQRTGAVAAVAVPGKGRRALGRAETAARAELRSSTSGGRIRPRADDVTAAFLTVGIGLVTSSVAERGEEASTRTRGAADGRTVDIGVGSTTASGRVRTVAVVESAGGNRAPAFRSVETLDGLPCPDEAGLVELDLRVESEVRSDRETVSTVTQAEVFAEVGDRADLTRAEATLSTSTTAGGGGASGMVVLDPAGRLEEVVVTDPPADGAARRRAEEGIAAARALAVGALAAAQDRWASGACVQVAASLPEEVEEGSSTELVPAVTSTFDGTAVDADVTVEVKGPGTVRQQGAGWVFVAGGERGRTSTVRVRAVSRRGAAVAALEVATPSPDLRVDGSYKSVRVRGVKCSGPAGRWEVDLVGGGGSDVGGLSFRLDGDLRGSYSGSRSFASLAGTITVSEGGAVRYLPDRGVLLLADREGGQVEVPVELGAYC